MTLKSMRPQDTERECIICALRIVRQWQCAMKTFPDLVLFEEAKKMAQKKCCKPQCSICMVESLVFKMKVKNMSTKYRFPISSAMLKVLLHFPTCWSLFEVS